MTRPPVSKSNIERNSKAMTLEDFILIRSNYQSMLLMILQIEETLKQLSNLDKILSKLNVIKLPLRVKNRNKPFSYKVEIGISIFS